MEIDSMKKGIATVFSLHFIFFIVYWPCFLSYYFLNMKKTSILSLLWLAGLLAFLATPTFAQEVEEDIVAASENVITDDAAVAEDTAVDSSVYEQDYWDEEDAVALDTENSDSSFEDAIRNDPEAVKNLNEAMDEVLSGLELSEEDIADFEANFETPEDRAVAAAGLGLLLGGIWIVWIIVSIIVAIFWIIVLWIIFKKAWEKWWKAIIPIWNAYILFKIAGMKNWFWYMLLIAFVLWCIAWFLPKYEEPIGIIASIICGIITIVSSYKLPRKFGWGVFTSILYVLFTPICQIILAFGNSEYQGKKED